MYITLENDLGFMRKRQAPAVIRSHRVNREKEPELYFYSRILLYYPWRSEANLMDGYPSYEAKYTDVKGTVETNFSPI